MTIPQAHKYLPQKKSYLFSLLTNPDCLADCVDMRMVCFQIEKRKKIPNSVSNCHIAASSANVKCNLINID